MDYSQNCHGYAFGVGDCPSDGGYGASIILNEGVCYAMTDTLSAEIAMLAGNSHSIKVVGGLCINSGTGSSVIKSTSEKYRESAIYKQENQAGATVVVPINAHGFGASLGGLYKKL